MDHLARRRIVQYFHRCFELTLAPIIFRTHLSWTLLRLTYWTAGWSFYPAITCAMYVFRMCSLHLVNVYETARNRELNQHRILREILSYEGLNRGRVFVALLMIACWHIHVGEKCTECLLKFADNACVKARGKRASELILQHHSA
jgi:hypothetical protein